MSKIECPFCMAKFDQKKKISGESGGLKCSQDYNYIAHLEKYHFDTAEEIEVLCCKNCPFKTGNKPVFNKHFMFDVKHCRPDQKYFKCEFCDFVQPNLRFTKQHVKQFHADKLIGKVDIFTCTKCNYQVGYSNLFEEHKLRCVGKTSEKLANSTKQSQIQSEIKREPVDLIPKDHSRTETISTPIPVFKGKSSEKIANSSEEGQIQSEIKIETEDLNLKDNSSTEIINTPKGQIQLEIKTEPQDLNNSSTEIISTPISVFKKIPVSKINCSMCMAKFDNKYQQNDHNKIFHFETVQGIFVLKCKICSFKTGSKIVYDEHRKLEGQCKSDKNNFKCAHCDRIFGGSKLYKRHLKRLHLDKLEEKSKIWYKCRCKYQTASLSCFEKHKSKCLRKNHNIATFTRTNKAKDGKNNTVMKEESETLYKCKRIPMLCKYQTASLICFEKHKSNCKRSDHTSTSVKSKDEKNNTPMIKDTAVLQKEDSMVKIICGMNTISSNHQKSNFIDVTDTIMDISEDPIADIIVRDESGYTDEITELDEMVTDPIIFCETSYNIEKS